MTPLRRRLRGLIGIASCTVGLVGDASHLVGAHDPPVPIDSRLVALAHPSDTAASQRAFAAELVGALATPTDANLIVGPTTVFDALAMLRAGARGASAQQLDVALHSTATPLDLMAGVASLAQSAVGDDQALSLARAAWVEQSYPIRREYADLVTRAGAPPTSVDFIDAPETARARINQWVEENTRGRIPDLFGFGSIHTMTRLVLASAMALDARWATPFKHSDTSQASFATPHGAHEVATMHRIDQLAYGSGPDYQAVELPYAGSRLAAMVVLPASGVDPLSLAGTLDAITAGLGPTQVALSMPRVEAAQGIDLHPALTRLGLGGLFHTSQADLSGIGGRPGDLVVDRVLHRTWLAFDEDGTRAAAVTGISVVATSARVGPMPRVMRVDRPFLFVVRDTATGLPLIIARIVDPS